MKKVIRSPLDRLPLDVKQQIVGWLTTGGPDSIGISYKAATAKLLAEHGVKTTEGGLCKFMKRFRPLSRTVQTIDVVVPSGVQTLSFTINLRTETTNPEGNRSQ